MTQAGLILEGGGMRGVYTAGVLDFLLDQNLSFASVYGVSAGACHACSFLSGQRRRAFDVAVDYLEDKRYAGVYSFLTTGSWFGWEMTFDIIPNQLNAYDYDAQAKNPSKFFAVVTNCETGKPEYIHITDLRKELPVICASSSLPFLAPIVTLGGKPYLDGGLTDAIPYQKSVDDGHKKNLVILTRDRDYRKKPSKLYQLAKAKYKKYPALIQCLKNRHLMYNQRLDAVAAAEKRGDAFVIRPQAPVTIGRLEKDRKKLETLYYDGYRDAEMRYLALRAFLDTAAEKENSSSDAGNSDIGGTKTK